MPTRLSIAAVLVPGMVTLGTVTAYGQPAATGSAAAYPARPVRLITGEAGGANDMVARLLAQGLAGPLGQSLLVENRPSSLTGELVLKAAPDGYTLLVAGGTFWIGHLLQKTPYDVVRDFLPISLVASAPNVLVVHPSLPVKSVKELIALAKSRPGELNYASGGTGSSNHLAGESFIAKAGVNIVRIGYKGSGPALNALIGGHVEMSFPPAAAVTPHLKAGRLRGLAVTSAAPSAVAPGMPTVAASGVPGYVSASTQGMLAPAKTPRAVIDRLNQEIARFARMTEVKDRFLSSGTEAVSSSPEEFSAYIKSEIASTSKILLKPAAGSRTD